MAVSTRAFAFASAVFTWLTAPSLPGLFTRTVTLRLLGLSWVAFAFAFAAALAFAPAVPLAAADACALADALFDCAVPLPLPGCPTSTVTLVFAGVVCVAFASPCVAAAVVVGDVVAGDAVVLVVGSEAVLPGSEVEGEAALGVELTSLDELAAPSLGTLSFELVALELASLGLVAAGVAVVSFGFVPDVVVDVGASFLGAASVGAAPPVPAAVGCAAAVSAAGLADAELAVGVVPESPARAVADQAAKTSSVTASRQAKRERRVSPTSLSAAPLPSPLSSQSALCV
jgi:hypothetical protein